MIFEGDEQLLTEYTAETKKKKGIPANATLGSNGWWWIGLKPAGKVIKGKFVPIAKLKKALAAKKKKALALKKKTLAKLKNKKKTAPTKTKSVQYNLSKLKNFAFVKNAIKYGDEVSLYSIKKYIGLGKKDLQAINNAILAAGGDEDEEGIYINPEGAVYFGHKFGKRKLSNQAKTKLPKTNAPVKKVKPFGSIESFEEKQKAIQTIQSLKKQLYHAAFGGDEFQIEDALSFGDDIIVPKKDFQNMTGLSLQQTRELIDELMIDDKIWVGYNGIGIRPSFWKSKLTKPKPPVKNIKGLELGPQVRDNSDVIKKFKLKEPPKTVAKVEAKTHGKLITTDYKLSDVVEDWQNDSVWGYESSHRNKIFKTINETIKNKKLAVKQAKTLYRGMHFYSHKSGFGKTILNTFRQGATVKLKPSGFSISPSKALSFAEVGDKGLSVLFIVVPKPKSALRAMHIWNKPNKSMYSAEREVITAEAKYKVLSTVLSKSFEDSMHLTIQLQQMTLISDNINEIENIETQSPETIVDFLFCDTMSNTSKNLRKLEAKKKTSLKSEDTYMKEDGTPSPALVSPDGSIKGAPKPDEVKKMRQHLNQEK